MAVLADRRREVDRLAESHILLRAEHRRNQRHEQQAGTHQHATTNAGFSQPRRCVQSTARRPRRPPQTAWDRPAQRNSPCRQDHEDARCHNVRPAQHAIAAAFATKEQPVQSRQPQREGEGIHHQHLLQHEGAQDRAPRRGLRRGCCASTARRASRGGCSTAGWAGR